MRAQAGFVVGLFQKRLTERRNAIRHQIGLLVLRRGQGLSFCSRDQQ